MSISSIVNMESLAGMTINERLFALNKMDSFDQAITAGDKERAIQILESCDLSKKAATSTVTDIFRSPQKYGYSIK
ncbi:hypothetical protein RT723_11105 [Psychrosphaera aquimarina]|uniref:Uncharacterized protein n=1 Tax=Psychrosphaera aquimarina TaxID=2044854 RepID=A0ABU3R1H2_9GAMM|nr:hypothetical protein [Psychrosphaera aquimarina]MDU0113535.1 hypothetical protein [Psychrosphaera aquimarina]